MGYREALRSSGFAWLWSGMAVSRLGDEVTFIGLLWYLVSDLGSPAAAGTAMFFMSGAAVVSGFISGPLLDRYSRRTLLLVDNIGRGLIVMSIPLIHSLGALETWILYPALAAVGALSVLTEAGVKAVVPDLVPAAHLDSANALESLGNRIGQIVGPAAAGFLAAGLGALNLLWIDSLTFFYMAAMVLVPPRAAMDRASCAGPSRPVLRDFKDGLAFIVRRPVIRAIVVMFVVINITAGLQTIGLPLYTEERLTGGAAGLGLLFSTSAAGSLVGTFLVGLKNWRLHLGRGIGLALCLYGLLFSMLGWTHHVSRTLMVVFICGALVAPIVIWSVTLRQRYTPSNLRGKVFSLSISLDRTAQPIGTMAGGIIASYAGGVAVVVASGITALLAGAGGLALGLWGDRGTSSPASGAEPPTGGAPQGSPPSQQPQVST